MGFAVTAATFHKQDTPQLTTKPRGSSPQFASVLLGLYEVYEVYKSCLHYKQHGTTYGLLRDNPDN